MTAFPSYSTGTITVTAGATTSVGTGTYFAEPDVMPGDELVVEIANVAYSVTLLDVTDTTHITHPKWPGPSSSGAVAYTIFKKSPQRYSGFTVTTWVDQILSLLRSTAVRLYNFVRAASRPAAITSAGEGHWIKTVSGTAWEVYFFDGTSDILVGTFNPTAHTWAAASSGLIASTNTTEATTGGAGAITTAGGIYAAKKIVSSSDVVTTNLLVGTDVKYPLQGAVGLVPAQCHGTSVGGGYGAVRWSNDVYGASSFFTKSRGAAVGTRGIVAADDQVGGFTWTADDGVQFVSVAAMRAYVDGTPGVNNMPGRLAFYTTADGASSVTERVRITNAGNVGIGTTSPGTYGKLEVSGAGYTAMAVKSNDGVIMVNAANSSIGARMGTVSNHPLGLYSNGTEKVTILEGGNVGIGTTSPIGKISLGKITDQTNTVSYANCDQAVFQFYQAQNFPGANNYQRVLDIVAGGGNAGGNIRFLTQAIGAAAVAAMTINKDGGVGIGTVAPSAVLHNVTSTRHAHLGAGTVTSDASGNLSVSSDTRLKTIDGDFTRGIEAIRSLTPILYHWNETSGLDQLNQYAGFSAQQVQAAIPEAVGEDDRGFLTLSDRALIAATVNAVKQLDARLTAAGL
jgi:hypothetical protein